VSKLVAAGQTVQDAAEAGDVPVTGDEMPVNGVALAAGGTASDASAGVAVPKAVAFDDDGEVTDNAEKKANLCAAPAFPPPPPPPLLSSLPFSPLSFV
jgi:hypothetical protein